MCILQSLLIFGYIFEEAFFSDKTILNFVFLVVLAFVPLKDYLIALGFAAMYYRQGIKEQERVLTEIEKEKLLFDDVIHQGTGSTSNKS